MVDDDDDIIKNIILINYLIIEINEIILDEDHDSVNNLNQCKN
jgi:hypothetical protein